MNMENLKDPDYILTKETSINNIRKEFNHISKMLKRWNSTWRDEYLTSLLEHHYGGNTQPASRTLKEGEIVLIKNDTNRSSWPLGKVVEVFPDKAGALRLVKILSKGNVSLRTVDKLVPLEITDRNGNPEEANPPPQGRIKRRAAINARKRWMDHL